MEGGVPVRFRISFESPGMLSEEEEGKGFKSSWYSTPASARIVEDLMGCIVSNFGLRESCPLGIYLELNDFVLPKFLPVTILREGDLIKIYRANADTNPMSITQYRNNFPIVESSKKELFSPSSSTLKLVDPDLPTEMGQPFSPISMQNSDLKSNSFRKNTSMIKHVRVGKGKEQVRNETNENYGEDEEYDDTSMRKQVKSIVNHSNVSKKLNLSSKKSKSVKFEKSYNPLLQKVLFEVRSLSSVFENFFGSKFFESFSSGLRFKDERKLDKAKRNWDKKLNEKIEELLKSKLKKIDVKSLKFSGSEKSGSDNDDDDLDEKDETVSDTRVTDSECDNDEDEKERTRGKESSDEEEVEVDENLDRKTQDKREKKEEDEDTDEEDEQDEVNEVNTDKTTMNGDKFFIAKPFNSDSNDSKPKGKKTKSKSSSKKTSKQAAKSARIKGKEQKRVIEVENEQKRIDQSIGPIIATDDLLNDVKGMTAEKMHAAQENGKGKPEMSVEKEQIKENETDGETKETKTLNERETEKKEPSRSAKRKKAKRQWIRLQKEQAKQMTINNTAPEISENDVVPKSETGCNDKEVKDKKYDENIDEENVSPNQSNITVVKKGHVRFYEDEAEHNNEDKENGYSLKNYQPININLGSITSKKRGQVWGQMKKQNKKQLRTEGHFSFNKDQVSNRESFPPPESYESVKKDLEKESSKADGLKYSQSGNNFSPSAQKRVEEINRKIQDIPSAVNIIPQNGSFLAYKILELSNWNPQISLFRVGIVSEFDEKMSEIHLLPAEFTVQMVQLEKTDSNPLKEDPATTSLESIFDYPYSPDGSLKIDFPSLLDIKVLPPNVSECKTFSDFENFCANPENFKAPSLHSMASQAPKNQTPGLDEPVPVKQHTEPIPEPPYSLDKQCLRVTAERPSSGVPERAVSGSGLHGLAPSKSSLPTPLALVFSPAEKRQSRQRLKASLMELRLGHWSTYF